MPPYSFVVQDVLVILIHEVSLTINHVLEKRTVRKQQLQGFVALTFKKHILSFLIKTQTSIFEFCSTDF